MDETPYMTPAQLEKLDKVCSNKVWMECGGQCEFTESGTCRARGILPYKDSYYTRWLKIYVPVYEAIQRGQNTGMRRSPSIERKPAWF